MAANRSSSERGSGGWGWLWWLALLAGGFFLLSHDSMRERRDHWLAKLTGGSSAQAKEFFRSLEEKARTLRERGQATLVIGPGAEKPSSEKSEGRETSRSEAGKKSAPAKDHLTKEDRKALDNLIDSL